MDSPDCLTQEPHAVFLNSARDGEAVRIDGPGLRYENCRIVIDSPEGFSLIDSYFKGFAKDNSQHPLLEFRGCTIQYGGGALPADSRLLFRDCLFILSYPGLPSQDGCRFTEIAEVSNGQSFAFASD